MEFKSWDGTKMISLLPCPFCGADPIVRHVGNDNTKKRSIKVKCSNYQCRVEQTNGAIYHGFDFIEDVAEKNWNKRNHNDLIQADTCPISKYCKNYIKDGCGYEPCGVFEPRPR